MSRELRTRAAGLVFYLFLLLLLVSTPAAATALRDLIGANTNPAWLATFLVAGAAVFTSDAVGYLFSSIVYALFRVSGGYSWYYANRLAYRGFRNEILQRYSGSRIRSRHNLDSTAFEAALPSYNPEQLLVYFFWHNSTDRNPLDEWVERRHTAFFAGLTAALALLLAAILALAVICISNLGLSWITAGLLALTIVLIMALVGNAISAMADACRIIDLRIAGIVNPKIAAMSSDFKSSRGKSRAA